MKRKYKIVAIDFDGVLYDGKSIIQGSAEGLAWFKEHGYKIILWTCRNGNRLANAKNILRKAGILHYFDAINENIEPTLYKTSRKILCSIFIDDKNIGGFPGWDKIIKIMEEGNTNEA